MKRHTPALLLPFFLLAGASPASAQEQAPLRPLPEAQVEARVEAVDGSPQRVSGTMRLRQLTPEAGGLVCFYLPYEDPAYGDDRGTGRRFEVFANRNAQVHFEGGSLEARPRPPARARLGSPGFVLRLALPGGWSAHDELVLDLEATVPRLPRSDPNDWFFDGFLPRLLTHCPPEGLDTAHYRTTQAARYRGHLQLPSGWQYAGPGQLGEGDQVSFDLEASTLAFALGRGQQRRDLKVSGREVSLLYHTPAFADLAETVEAVLPTLVRLFGPFPYEKLQIIETTELQRHGLPGLIAINRPPQKVFHEVQKEYLNWHHWILAIQLARQWYGGAISPASPDDEWLLAGIAEYATLEALSRYQARFDLFNPVAAGRRLLSFDFLQVSEISAAMLRRFAPFAALTAPDFTTRDAAATQHPLLFVKQAFALRQLASFAGERAFSGFLRNLTTQHLHRTLAPRDLVTFLDRLPSPFAPPLRRDLRTFLTRWWVDEGWPDFALGAFTSEPLPDGRWLVQVSAEQHGSIDFPPEFGVTDESGRVTIRRADQPAGDGVWKSSLVTRYRPTQAVVDPGRETFDADRFNNTSEWPGLAFFPGSATTLADDTYTVAWVPYPFRRPGEPFSLGLQAMLLRYVEGSLYLRAETAPSEKLGAAEARYLRQWPSQALLGGVVIEQDYDSDRRAELSLSRSPLWVGEPNVALGLKTRLRERAGEPETLHGTASFALNIKGATLSDACAYHLAGEVEQAPAAWAKGFSYQRSFSVLSGDCALAPRVSLGVRAFTGLLRGEGPLPEAALFKPNALQEARLRLDLSLARVRRLSALGLDLQLPFYVPLPSDTLILTRQMRWRLFYDYGRSLDQELTYRSTGFGFFLPFGGDLAGAGSLALTRVSLLAILYSRAGDEVSRRPGLVLDLSGQL